VQAMQAVTLAMSWVRTRTGRWAAPNASTNVRMTVIYQTAPTRGKDVMDAILAAGGGGAKWDSGQMPQPRQRGTQ
jgi:hypothetical protein